MKNITLMLLAATLSLSFEAYAAPKKKQRTEKPAGAEVTVISDSDDDQTQESTTQAPTASVRKTAFQQEIDNLNEITRAIRLEQKDKNGETPFAFNARQARFAQSQIARYKSNLEETLKNKNITDKNREILINEIKEDINFMEDKETEWTSDLNWINAHQSTKSALMLMQEKLLQELSREERKKYETDITTLIMIRIGTNNTQDLIDQRETDSNGNTLLHRTVLTGHLNATSWLLDALVGQQTKANKENFEETKKYTDYLNKKNNAGKTALELATEMAVFTNAENWIALLELIEKMQPPTPFTPPAAPTAPAYAYTYVRMVHDNAEDYKKKQQKIQEEIRRQQEVIIQLIAQFYREKEERFEEARQQIQQAQEQARIAQQEAAAYRPAYRYR